MLKFNFNKKLPLVGNLDFLILKVSDHKVKLLINSYEEGEIKKSITKNFCLWVIVECWKNISKGAFLSEQITKVEMMTIASGVQKIEQMKLSKYATLTKNKFCIIKTRDFTKYANEEIVNVEVSRFERYFSDSKSKYAEYAEITFLVKNKRIIDHIISGLWIFGA